MDHDHCAVFTGEIYLYLIDPHDPHLAAAQRLAPDSHRLTRGIDHGNIYGVRMDIGFDLIRCKRVSDSLFRSQIKGIPDPHIIGIKSHDSAKQRPVCTMTVIRPGKRTVESKIHFHHRASDHFLGQKSDPRSSCCVGTGRPDHVRAKYIKNTDKGHAVSRLLNEEN